MKTSRELPPLSEENYHKAAAELIREAWPLFFYYIWYAMLMLADKNVYLNEILSDRT